MTGSQLYEHILGVLLNHPNHTIVRHKKPSGELCWRIRDESITPIANFSDTIFKNMQDENLLIKINDRECWQREKTRSYTVSLRPSEKKKLEKKYISLSKAIKTLL